MSSDSSESAVRIWSIGDAAAIPFGAKLEIITARTLEQTNKSYNKFIAQPSNGYVMDQVYYRELSYMTATKDYVLTVFFSVRVDKI